MLTKASQTQPRSRTHRSNRGNTNDLNAAYVQASADSGGTRLLIAPCQGIPISQIENLQEASVGFVGFASPSATPNRRRLR